MSTAGDLFLDVMSTVAESLEGSAVTYAVTGSIASSIHGEPLVSNDVDICLRMTPAQARRLADSLPSRFYRDATAMVEAATRGAMVNLIDMQTQLKVDLSILPTEPYFDEVLKRRRRVEYLKSGISFWIVSAEDVILMKLLWRRSTGSQKQWDNALSVVRTQGASLEWGYLRDWAGRLGVLADLEKLRDEGGI